MHLHHKPMTALYRAKDVMDVERRIVEAWPLFKRGRKNTVRTNAASV